VPASQVVSVRNARFLISRHAAPDLIGSSRVSSVSSFVVVLHRCFHCCRYCWSISDRCKTDLMASTTTTTKYLETSDSCFSLCFCVPFIISATVCTPILLPSTSPAVSLLSAVFFWHFVDSFPRFITRNTVVQIHFQFLVVYNGEDESTTLVAVSVQCACKDDDSFTESFFHEPQFVRLPHVSGCFRGV
jgi:hypothetical protein